MHILALGSLVGIDGSLIDATVVLGTADVNQSQTPLRLVGYAVDRVKCWIATNRHDLTAEQIAQAYKLRLNIDNFMGVAPLQNN